ncbi:uncharacterized protein LOC105703546 [Orussus abietinus]|uniref:uncharacterized protein LOC105703546 n=1 Tax=Orussus abietinus TaxID=222816 RepID=UPI0006264F8A|nr:uncharacterized protein LOC105703546 [Orussus abietinus]
MSDANETSTQDAGNEPYEEIPGARRCEADSRMTETDMSMLEDEEMPTYISVSSPSRMEDTIGERRQHLSEVGKEDPSPSPCRSDEQGGDDSVYVVSSGEETDRPPYPEDEDYDTEEMEELEQEDELDDEEEDEDVEDEQPLTSASEEESDGDIEPEPFDRASDDLNLRHSNGLTKIHKKKYRSLQDLSHSKETSQARYVDKRHSVDALEYNDFGFPRKPFAKFQPARVKSVDRRSVGSKYGHVQSKVKLYIQEIKEQNRRSMEKRMKGRECTINSNYSDTKKKDFPNSEETTKTFATLKNLKPYAEITLKDLANETVTIRNDLVSNSIHVMENGEEMITVKRLTVENDYTDEERDMEVDIEPLQPAKIMKSTEESLGKPNGAVGVDSGNHFSESHPEKPEDFPTLVGPCLFNGQEQSSTLINLQTLSYEEYMKGASVPDDKVDAPENLCLEEQIEPLVHENNINMPELEETSDMCQLKIESVTSICVPDEEPGELPESRNSKQQLRSISEKLEERRNQENREISVLRSQLDQKTAQCNGIREVYQKTLSENLELKKELEEMKRAFAKYQSDHRRPETKVVAIQTDPSDPPPEVELKSSETNGLTEPKMSTSSTASTGRSHLWSESSYSPSISTQPPSLTRILNNDDTMSIVEDTPNKFAKPLSSAFVTSSRILQTLSDITQGKAKEGVTSISDKVQELASPVGSVNSKKRKATDMLGVPGLLQPSKIPHTAGDSKRRTNSSFDSDGEFKHPGEYLMKGLLNPRATSSVAETTSQLDLSQQDREDSMDDGQEEEVKCFVYQEDEHSKDRSFLIQAHEPKKVEKGTIRECGPYLLGNVEVRMSEVNGTINIWGKEIPSDSVFEEEGESDASKKFLDTSTTSPWQKSPRSRFFNGNHLACSTSKKLRTLPRLNDSTSSRGSRSTDFGADKRMQEDDTQEYQPSCSFKTPTNRCRHCDGHNRLSWPSCQNSNIGNRHACSPNYSEQRSEAQCCHQEKHDESHPHCQVPRNAHQTCSTCLEKFQAVGKHPAVCCGNHSPGCAEGDPRRRGLGWQRRCEDEACQQGARNASHPRLGEDKGCQRDERTPQGRTCEEENCQHCGRRSRYNATYTPSAANLNQGGHSLSGNRSPSTQSENDLLIPNRATLEAPEVRRRRLSGKRVRGILLDFLKGCGDCRPPASSSSIYKSNVNQEKEQSPANRIPQIRVTPCSSGNSSMAELSREKTPSTESTGRCCQCSRRKEVATEMEAQMESMRLEMEAQMEFMRVKMEKLRSRSEAVVDMIHMLYSSDLN